MKGKRDMPYDKDPDGIIWLSKVGLVVILLLVIGTIAFALLRPRLNQLQSSADRNSPQFIDAVVTHLQNLQQDYLRLETEIADFGSDPQYAKSVENRQSQQAAILSTMREEAAQIDVRFIPTSILVFLDQHPTN